MNFLLIGLSVVPALVLLEYFLKQDNVHDQEPKKLVWRVFRWGMLAVVMAGIIEVVVEEYFGGLEVAQVNPALYILLFSALLPGVVEESLKFWVVKTTIYHDKHFSEPLDGIMYAVIASLGFAMLENIFYVLGEASFVEGLVLGVFRAAMSVPGHALFSGVMGYYIGQAKFCGDTNKARSLQIKGLISAILLHATYNFSVSFNPMIGLVVVAVLIASMFMFLRRKMKELKKVSEKATSSKI